MTQREERILHYTVIMMIHDDARRMSNTLRDSFTQEERHEMKELTTMYANRNLKKFQRAAFDTMRSVLPE